VKVTVTLLGSLRTLAGGALMSFEVEKGSNLKVILQELSVNYPSLIEVLSKVPRTTLIIINGIEIGNLQGTETMIRTDANITMIPVIHGG
jgi:molybdopterin converting factor small subunit